MLSEEVGHLPELHRVVNMHCPKEGATSTMNGKDPSMLQPGTVGAL